MVLGCWASPRDAMDPHGSARYPEPNSSKGRQEMNPYFCFLGRSWSLLAVHETRSVFSHQAAPAPNSSGQQGGSLLRISPTRISPPPAQLCSTQLPFPQKAELNPARAPREQQTEHHILPKPPQALPCTSSSSHSPVPSQFHPQGIYLHERDI